MYPMKLRFFLSFAAAFALSAACTSARAQVTINMSTTQGNCVAVTDVDGLQLINGTSGFSATGVGLSGTGCQPQGGGNSDFATTVSVPSTATVPTTVNVQWSASPSATQCVYSGTNASGWPVGALACSGGACTGPHTQPVSLTNAGNYTFGMSCTNNTGYDSKSLVATGSASAPTPPNFPLTATPSNGLTGTPFQIAWNVSGATSCTGAADLNGNSVTLPGWTTLTTPISPRTAIPTVAGTYTLSMVCSNVTGSVNSQSTTIVVQQGDPSCPSSPLTRQTVGSIQYPPAVGSGKPTRQNVDLTYWDNIWGHQTATDNVVPFPGISGTSPVITAFGRNNYIAAKFHVGSVPLTLQGYYKNVSNFGGLDVTTAISKVCGDFMPPQVGCQGKSASASDRATTYWRMENPTNFNCKLDPNTDYYFNVKNTTPTQDSPNCAAGAPTCRLHVLSNASSQ